MDTAQTKLEPVSSPLSLFGAHVPPSADDPDQRAMEVGVKWTAAVPGRVTGIRFHKGPSNTGKHIGHLWNAQGTLLGDVTFVNETASGWQYAALPVPVEVQAGKVYVASYWAPEGHYSANQGWFANEQNPSGPLRALNDGEAGANGVFRYNESGFPTDSYGASNYWVDILFVPASASTTTIPTTTVPTIPTTTTPALTAPPTTAAPPMTAALRATDTPRTTAPPTTAPPTTPPNPPTTLLRPMSPPAPPAEWPSSSNTGVPAGTALAKSGSLTITQAGAVVEGRDVSGTVTIESDNVTFRRSRVSGGDLVLIRIKDGISGVRIEDVEVIGQGAAGPTNSIGIYGAATVVRTDLHGFENGIVPESGSTILDSYIHDLAGSGSAHYDGIQIDGGQERIIIRHNTIAAPAQTSAVMIDNYFGSISDITVDNNKLSGGTYAVYSDGQFDGGLVQGVRITNNRFGPSQYGHVLVRGNSLAANDGNVRDFDGQSVHI